MKRLWLCLSVLSALIASSGWTPVARAQTRGTISGVVSGPNGPISGLTVNVINNAGSVMGTAVTMQSGAYTVGGLAPGTYTIQIVSQGAVIATSVGTVAANVVAATVDVTLTASQLAAAAVAAGGGSGGGVAGTLLGLSTKAVLTGAAIAGGGVLVYKAATQDSSPTQ